MFRSIRTIPKERIRIILEDAHCAAAFTLTQSSRCWASFSAGFSGDAICLDTDWPKIEGEPEEEPTTCAKPEPQHTCCSPRAPPGVRRGVALEHRSAAAFVYLGVEVYTARAVKRSFTDRILQ